MVCTTGHTYRVPETRMYTSDLCTPFRFAAPPLPCNSLLHAVMETPKMTETCIMRFRDLPSTDMKKAVKKFLKNEQVEVEDDVGRSYRIVMRRNGLVLTDL